MQLTEAERTLIEKLRAPDQADFMLTIMRVVLPDKSLMWTVSAAQPLDHGVVPHWGIATRFEGAWLTAMAMQEAPARRQ